MKNKKKLIIVLLVFLLALGATIFSYINKDHRNISDEKTDISTTSKEFFSSFTTNQQEFNSLYLDKAIVLKGIVTSIEDNSIVLDEKVIVTFKENAISGIKTNTEITVKGRYVGYDDLLEQLKIDQATNTNK